MNREEQVICLALSYMLANLEDAVEAFVDDAEIPYDDQVVVLDGARIAIPTEPEIQELIRQTRGTKAG